MWIAIAIIVCVYMAIFIAESLWNFAALTPPKVYGEQVARIGELTTQNSALEAAEAERRKVKLEFWLRREGAALVPKLMEISGSMYHAQVSKVILVISNQGSVPMKLSNCSFLDTSRTPSRLMYQELMTVVSPGPEFCVDVTETLVRALSSPSSPDFHAIRGRHSVRVGVSYEQDRQVHTKEDDFLVVADTASGGSLVVTCIRSE